MRRLLLAVGILGGCDFAFRLDLAEIPPRPDAAPIVGRWLAAEAGNAHTCALDEAGALYCWGRNDGQLGNGAAWRADFVQVP